MTNRCCLASLALRTVERRMHQCRSCGPMEIPYTELSDEALRGIIEEYITREGTEYGAREFSLEQKIEHVRQQLLRREIEINFDAETQSCNLVAVG